MLFIPDFGFLFQEAYKASCEEVRKTADEQEQRRLRLIKKQQIMKFITNYPIVIRESNATFDFQAGTTLEVQGFEMTPLAPLSPLVQPKVSPLQNAQDYLKRNPGDGQRGCAGSTQAEVSQGIKDGCGNPGPQGTVGIPGPSKEEVAADKVYASLTALSEAGVLPPPRPKSIITGQIETLSQLTQGPVTDGGMISKHHRDEMHKAGYVDRVEGFNSLSLAGVKLCYQLGLIKH